MLPENRPWFEKVTRREFIAGAAAVAASLGPFRTAAADSPGTAEVAFLLPPHLSCATATSIRISAVNASGPTEAVLEMSRPGTQTWERPLPVAKAAPYEILHWTVPGLSDGSYRYRVLVRNDPKTEFREATSGSFRTQRQKASNYTALLMTDPHTGSFPPGSGPVLTLDKVVQNARALEPEFVLDLGDNVAWAGSREFPQRDARGATSAYARYRRQIAPLSSRAPFYPILGNWNGESGKFPQSSIETVANVRRSLLPAPNHLTYPQGGSAGEDYYAFSWGDALYVMLNIQTYSKPSQPERLPSPMADVNRVDEWTLGDAQMAWFEKTLKNASERFRFVCMHHPAGGNAGDELNTLYGRGGPRAWNTGEQRRIHALMKKHQVQVFFYGHDHVFVDEIVDGIHYTLPGSCGAPWKFTKAETGYERSWPDSGHARLEVSPEKATVTFYNLENKVLHRFSVPAA